MSDLSNLLGDVYGDHRSADAAPVRHEPSADLRAPQWADESQLDRAFEGWVPGEPPTESRPDDLTAALAAALAAPTPAPTPAPAPAPAPFYDAVPLPSLAPAPAPLVPVQAAAPWTTSAPGPAPAPAPAPVIVSAPAAVTMWSPGDDDIFPMAKGGRKVKAKKK